MHDLDFNVKDKTDGLRQFYSTGRDHTYSKCTLSTTIKALDAAVRHGMILEQLCREATLNKRNKSNQK